MKTNKTMTYLLIVLVIGIWGYVSYRIIAGITGDKNSDIIYVQPRNEPVVRLAYYQWQDTLTYDSITQSPFLAVNSTNTVQIKEPISKEIETHNVVQEPAPPINIQYLGFIENQNKGQRIAIVQINGKQYYMNIQQKIEQHLLLQVNPENIKIKYNSETLTIYK